MIEKIIAYSIRNPVLIVAVSLLVTAWGIYAMFHTPVDAIPDLSENQVIVFADWPGRSPRELEDQVTYPLSVNLQGLAGVKAIRATSEFGFSMINIIFEDETDIYFARQRVLERISIAQTFLPASVQPYLAPDTTALGQIFWYTVEGDGYDLGRLRAIQDWFVRYQLYSVPGVAEVASVGGYPIEYQIDVDPAKLRAYDVTLGELYSAVARSNSAVGGRVVQKGGSEFLIRSIGWIQSTRDVENIVVKSVNGTPVYVSNVATVQLGSASRRSSLEKNGNEAVGGVVLMRYNENPLQVTAAIKDKIAQLQPGLPEGVRIVPFYDRTRLIESAIGTVRETLIEEMLVASLAIIVVMRHVRSALIICLTLPLAVLGSFILMRLLDIPSNIMSLSGIAISIGVLVDAAIVMVDQGAHTLHQHFGSTKVRGDTRELLTPALQTVGRPIFFSLMIMVISFVPVFLLGGMEGRMFHPLAFTKTFALVGVSILAITLVPAIIPWLVRGRVRGESENWIVRRVIEIYQPVLNFLLDHPWPIVWITGIILIVGLTPAIIGNGFWWGFFRTVVALAIVAAVWAVRKEEIGFRRLWWVVALIWSVAALVMLSIPGLQPAVTGSPGVANVRLAAMIVGAPVLSFIASWLLGRVQMLAKATMIASLFLIAVIADRNMSRLGREFMPPLNEGTILDMPITIPRASITQVADDLKARDALLRQFPEVELVVGKAGRAETPTDPAPPDMVETVVNLRPEEYWPKRELSEEDAKRQTSFVLKEMENRGWIETANREELSTLIDSGTKQALAKFDETMRAHALHDFSALSETLSRRLARFALSESIAMLKANGQLRRPVLPSDEDAVADVLQRQFGAALAAGPDVVTITKLAQRVGELLNEKGYVSGGPDLLALSKSPFGRVADLFKELAGEERETFFTRLLDRLTEDYHDAWAKRVKALNWQLVDSAGPTFTWQAILQLQEQTRMKGLWKRGDVDTTALQALRAAAEQPFSDNLMLWQRTQVGLVEEMKAVIQVPGWANIFTQPIINRIDMLATGVRTMIGVKVFGDDLNEIQRVSQAVADVLETVRGAAEVTPDQIVGEGYLEIEIDREKAARFGINVGDIQDVIETALGGQTITTTVEGRERFPVRIRYARDFRIDEESIKRLLVSGAESSVVATTQGEESPAARRAQQIPLSMVADVRIVEGPSMIKSENGLLRAYVQLNVRNRDIVGFVEEAQRAVAEQVTLPAGMYLEWSGQFEHQLRAKRTLSIIFPMVIVVIFVILYVTYHDFMDSVLVMGLAVPGAIAGGVLFQYLFGFNFSVAVWVGYIACFGLATENGLVMLVYLREAIDKRGGLANMTLAELRAAVMEGAVHRTRPKLLTEVTTLVGLAPMLWATGTGAEVMRPMAAPVLGGILVSDEVVDLLLPVLFFHLRKWRWKRIHGNAEMQPHTATAPVGPSFASLSRTVTA